MRTPLSTVSYHPRPDHRRNRSPSIEIVADSDLDEPRSSGVQRRTRRQGRRTNNHRPALDKVPSTMPLYHHKPPVNSQPFRWCRDQTQSDERLAEKYNELRRLLLNKLDLRALTPQVSRPPAMSSGPICHLMYHNRWSSNNSMGKTQFTPNRYRFSDSRGYCEVYQEISQILIKYPVTTGISLTSVFHKVV